MPGTKHGIATGFSILPDGLFRVSRYDCEEQMKKGFSRFAAEKAIVRQRILSLVRRDETVVNLQQIILYAMEKGLL